MSRDEGDQVGVDLEPVTLESICDGMAETNFQDELEKVSQLLQHPDQFADDQGKIEHKITITVKVVHDLETGHTFLETTSALQRPKRRAVRRRVFRSVDGWTTGKEPEQLAFEVTPPHRRQ